MKVALLLSLCLLTLTSARPQLDFGEDDEEYYDEGEYFYQEYEENGEDYGYYNYKDESDDTNESDDYGISRYSLFSFNFSFYRLATKC